MTHTALALAERIRSGAPAFAAWCGIPDPLIPELMVREGFDCAVLDMQHGAYDYAIATQAIANVAAAGKGAIVRIPVGEFTTASRMLDAGAAGIIAPMVNSVADAKLLAGFTKFPPLGERSWGPARALSISGLSPVDYLKQANDFSLTIAMIETRAAMRRSTRSLRLMASTASSSVLGPVHRPTNGATVNQLHPEVDKALDHIVARAKAAGKFASAFCADGKRAAEVAAKGYKLMSLGTDGVLLRAGCRAGLEEAQATGKASQQSAY